jgi:arsenical pump membrane protein
MAPVNLVSVAATLAALLWFFRKDIPADYDLAQLKRPAEAIHDRATFLAGWWVLGCCWPASSGSTTPAFRSAPSPRRAPCCCWRRRARPPDLDPRRAARGAMAGGRVLAGDVPGGVRPAQRRPDRLPDGLLDRCAEHGVWGAALGTGFITAILSSIMNNMPTVLVGALSIDATSPRAWCAKRWCTRT